MGGDGYNWRAPCFEPRPPTTRPDHLLTCCCFPQAKIAERAADADHRIIVFFTTARYAAFMHDVFNAAGFPVLEMHSRLSQATRTRTVAKFAKQPGNIIFASDVIARGMDFPDVSLVVQVRWREGFLLIMAVGLYLYALSCLIFLLRLNSAESGSGAQ